MDVPLPLPRDLWDNMAAYLRGIAQSIAPRPKAVLIISGHWETEVPTVNAAPAHSLYYDYYGFPEHTYRLTYPAKGSPDLAARVRDLLGRAGIDSATETGRGLDHGVFVPLKLVYPDADIPLVQLSLRHDLDAAAHLQIGQALQPLRDEGVLIVGSGNLVHNLHTYAWGRHLPDPYDWAIRFEQTARAMMVAGEVQPLIAYDTLGRDAMLSIPTPDHYLPLLYVLATRQQGESISFPVEGIDGGSISMLRVRIG
jgi:4,5-DOPA dioxygenase extradiol